MKYSNPVLFSDYSDPDAIRVGDDFYMVASSFNHVPGVPVLHSKNLVEWELINYVLPTLPFGKFNAVRHGEGAWAPSLRYHGGKFYCLIPFPDEGIFVSEADDPRGKWSLLRPLLTGKGYEDPCPLWDNGKCYVVFAFAKSRAGFNSRLAVFETDEFLKTPATRYAFVYDGHMQNPKIEGPKFYKKDGMYYILAPAGGVSSGWQTALRSEKIYGPYESRIVLMQGGTDINGPHQGALVDLDDDGQKWAFLHFTDMGAFGRVVCLEPARWENGWPLFGEISEPDLPGEPVKEGEYPVDIKTGVKFDPDDSFDSPRLSLKWQTPANPQEGWYSLKRGLKLNCVYHAEQSLSDLPQLFMQKICYRSFSAKCRCKLALKEDGDETGFVVFGKKYSYICVVRQGGNNYLEIRKGEIGGKEDETLCRSQPYADDYVTFQLSAGFENPNLLSYRFTFGGSAFTHRFYAAPGVWTGAKIGVYARSSNERSPGSALFGFFRVTEKR